MKQVEERYISLLTDFGFKRIFGTAMNKDLLICFLNSLFNGRQVVKDVSYLNPEHVGDVYTDRRAIFDVYCEGENGEKFIVEMQNAYQTYFKDRALFYSTFPIREQAPKGNDWDFKLNHVYTVALLNFSMNEDAFDKEKIRHHVQLCDTATHKVFYDKLEYIYVEISKFNKPLEELDTLYELNEKEARIAEQAFQLKIRNITLICILSGALLALFFLWRLWHQNCVIRNKNKALVKRINEQFSMQEEMDRSQLGVEKDLSFPEKVEDESGDNEEQDKQMNKMIFEKLDYIIKRDKLYLSPDLSREELTRIVRMNNTRFAKMIKENTDTNLSGYINNLRLNYAIHLMKEQPDYTLRAIAESSGINSMPTFHQLFKGRTGMTPLEFKDAQKNMGV